MCERDRAREYEYEKSCVWSSEDNFVETDKNIIEHEGIMIETT